MNKFISVPSEIEAIQLLDDPESICNVVDFRNEAKSVSFGSDDADSIVESVRSAGHISFMAHLPVQEDHNLSKCPFGHYLVRNIDGNLSTMDHASFTRFFKQKTEEQDGE